MSPKKRLKRWVVTVAERARFRGHGGRPESDFKQLFALAWPIAAAMCGETIIGLVDTKLVGGLGTSALGGVSMAATVMYLAYALLFGTMRGVKVRTAHAVGAGRAGESRAFAYAGIVIGLVLGTSVWALSQSGSWVFHALRVEPKLVPYAVEFFHAVGWGAPAIGIVTALVQYRQGLGDSRTPMIVGLFGNLLNAVFAYGLIYGRFGLPALGVSGAGYATATTEWIEACVLVWLLLRERAGARISIREGIREVATLGLPTGVHFVFEMLAFTTFTAILGSMHEQEIAAHQIAMATIRVSFLPGLAVAEAASVLIGRALGGSNMEAADRVTRTALAMATAFMAACGVAFGAFGSRIAQTFTSDPGVVLVATRLLLVAAVFQVLDAVNIVLRGALRGAKDVRVVAIIGISIVWTSIPTAAFVLGKLLGLGALGGWIGFLVETTLASIFFWRRWKTGAWRAAYARAQSWPEAVVSAH